MPTLEDDRVSLEVEEDQAVGNGNIDRGESDDRLKHEHRYGTSDDLHGTERGV